MIRPRRFLFDLLAVVLILVPFALSLAEAHSPFHVSGARFWVFNRNLEIGLDIPNGSGVRTLVSIPSLFVIAPCSVMPIVWWRARKRGDRTKSRIVGSLTPAWFAKAALVWVTLTTMAFGFGEMLSRLLLAIGIAFLLLLVSALPFSIFHLVGAHRGYSKRLQRLNQGECIACGYCLTGNVSGICPECGSPVEVSDSIETRRLSDRE